MHIVIIYVGGLNMNDGWMERTYSIFRDSAGYALALALIIGILYQTCQDIVTGNNEGARIRAE